MNQTYFSVEGLVFECHEQNPAYPPIHGQFARIKVSVNLQEPRPHARLKMEDRVKAGPVLLTLWNLGMGLWKYKPESISSQKN